MLTTSATCDSRQAKLTVLKAHLADPPADALHLAWPFFPTLTSIHSSVSKEAQLFFSLPCPFLGSQCPPRIPAERQGDQGGPSP